MVVGRKCRAAEYRTAGHYHSYYACSVNIENGDSSFLFLGEPPTKVGVPQNQDHEHPLRLAQPRLKLLTPGSYVTQFQIQKKLKERVDFTRLSTAICASNLA